MSKPPQDPKAPRTSAPPDKPIATIAGPVARKPAAQTLVGYEAPTPDTLIGYEAPTDEAPGHQVRTRSSGPMPPSKPAAPAPKPAARPTPAKGAPPVRASVAPPKPAAPARPTPAKGGPPPRVSAPAPRASAAPPPPRASAAPPLAKDEAAELDAMLGPSSAHTAPTVELLSSQSVVLLPSQELSLDGDPNRPQRTDQTEELTNLDVERLSVGTPPPVPTNSRPPSLSDLPAQSGRGWLFVGIPVVIVALGVAIYVSMSDEPEVAVAPVSDAPLAAPAGETPEAPPSTTSMVAAATDTTMAPSMAVAPSAMTDTSMAIAPSAMADTSMTVAVAPSAMTDTSMAPSTAVAPSTMTDTSMAATPSTAMTAAPSATPSATAPPAAIPATFDATRLNLLAPMPDVTARIARLRDSARESRAERELRTASRKMRSRDYAGAAEDYKSALAYLPTSIDAMIGLARIAVEQEHWDVALAWTQRGLAAEPRNTENLLLRGDAFAGADDREAARAAWRQVLEIDPRNRDARSRMRRRGSRRH